MKLVTVMVLGIAVSLGAVLPSEKATASAVTQTQVDEWTKHWQKRLDLSEWTITTLIVRVGDLRPETVGNLKWNSNEKTAVIKVLNPADYNLSPADVATDIEYTIVHELIHLELSVLPHDGTSKLTEERVVNRISEALFQLDKGGRYRPRTSLAKDFVKTAPAPADEASRAKAKP
ncbi:MAG TPA: hypothetical protein VKU01_02445 [Bryobacteraceae bacterium]|nr:hypothetical protein [Bryobacteraceae bacterium]